MTPPGIDALYEHADFVRRLARSLVADESKAQDLEQETWLAAMKRPAGHADGLRAWLATVMRNALRQDQRSSIRRGKREAAVPNPKATAAAERTLLRQELAKQITDSVKQLDMPYRTVISMRFYEDLSPRDIARQLDLPLETVRTRLKRALHQVSATLDRQHGGVRSRWSVAVVSAFGLHEPGAVAASSAVLTKAKGISAMVPELKWALGGLVFAALVITGVTLMTPTEVNTERTDSGLQSAEATRNARNSESGAPAALTSKTDAEGNPVNRLRTEEFASPGSSRTKAERDRLDAVGVAWIKGKLINPAGAAIAGAEVKLKSLDRNQTPVRILGLLAPHQLQRVLTDAEGYFEIRMNPDTQSQYILEADDGVHGIVNWCFRQLEAKSVTELGECMLPPVGSIQGVIADSKGQPVNETWAITCVPLTDLAAPALPRNLFSMTNPETGHFVIERVPVGEFALSASNQDHTLTVVSSSLQVRQNKVTKADLKPRGLNEAGTIDVSITAPLFEDIAATEVLLQEDGSTIAAGATIASASDGLISRFSNVKPGSYQVVIKHPHYARFESEKVQVGASVTAELKGDVQLLVRAQGPKGVAIEDFRASLSRSNSAGGPLHSKAGSAAGEQQFQGLPAGDFELTLTAQGYPTQSFPILSLRNGESRELALQLTHGNHFIGKVITMNDAIAPNAKLRILTQTQAETKRHSSDFRFHYSDIKVATNGEIRLPSMAPGSYVVSLALNEISRIERKVVISSAGMSPKGPLVFDFSRHGSLKGKLLVPPGRSTEGMQIGLLPAKIWDNPVTRYDSSPYMVNVDADGRFSAPCVPAEELVVFLGLAPTQGTARHPMPWSAHPECGRVVIQAGLTNEHDLSVQSLYPGEAKVLLDFEGKQPSGLKVRFQLVKQKQFVFNAEAQFHSANEATVKNLTPGTYVVTITPENGDHWVYKYPDLVEVSAGASIELKAQVKVVTGKIYFTDMKTKQPMSNQRIHWSLKGAMRGAVFTTDENGAAELALTPGDYYFYHSSDYGNLVEFLDRKTAWPIAPGAKSTLRIK